MGAAISNDHFYCLVKLAASMSHSSSPGYSEILSLRDQDLLLLLTDCDS